MSTKVRKIGNSAGVILPKAALAALGVEEGGAVEFAYAPGKVTIMPVESDPWAGWEEDSKRLGQLGLTEEEREWLDAPLADDVEWEWDGKL